MLCLFVLFKPLFVQRLDLVSNQSNFLERRAFEQIDDALKRFFSLSAELKLTGVLLLVDLFKSTLYLI